MGGTAAEEANDTEDNGTSCQRASPTNAAKAEAQNLAINATHETENPRL